MDRYLKFGTQIARLLHIPARKRTLVWLTWIAGNRGFPTTLEHPEAFLNAWGRPLACETSLLKVPRSSDHPSSPWSQPYSLPSNLNLNQNEHFLDVAIRRGVAGKNPIFNREITLWAPWSIPGHLWTSPGVWDKFLESSGGVDYSLSLSIHVYSPSSTLVSDHHVSSQNLKKNEMVLANIIREIKFVRVVFRCLMVAKQSL